MKKILDYLQELDLSEIESRLYLSLLETGPISVRELAEKIDIKRTTAYFHIDILIEKGLVMKLVQDSQKLVTPYPPEESLKNLTQQKLTAAQETQTLLPNILNEMKVNYKQVKDTNEAEIKYYKGKNGIKKIYEEALNSKELRSYANLKDIYDILPENLFSFETALKKNPNLKIWEIIENSPTAKEKVKFSTDTKKYFYKFMPNNLKLNSADILIYDGKVSIINIKNKNAISGIVLSDINYYNNSKILFDFIWGTISKV